MTPPAANIRCRLLELPAEIREQVWIHTVTNWTKARPGILEKQPIRVDYLNRPLPSAITRVNSQLRSETLHPYYQQNIFECWRPFFWQDDWSQSTLAYWLRSLGSEKIAWLTKIVLLYKDESELQYDIEDALRIEGFDIKPGILDRRREVSEYEMCYEGLGLPRCFGEKRHRGWFYSSD